MFVPHSFLFGVQGVIQIATVAFQPGIGMYFILLVGHFQVIDQIHVFDNAHLLLGSRNTPLIFVIEVLGHRIRHIFIKVEVAEVGHPGAVRCLMVNEEAERLVLIANTVHPVEGNIGNNICCIAFALQLLAIAYEGGIVVISLPYQDVPMVEPRRLGAQVPLPNHGCLVAGLLQKLGKGLLATVKHVSVGIVGITVGMAVLACKHAGTTRSAQRIGYKTVGEAHSLVSYPVNVRCLHITPVVGTDCLERMIVAHDVDNVHRFLNLFFFHVLAGRK